MPSNRQSLDQKRAQHALTKVKDVEDVLPTDEKRQRYNSLARSMPALVQTNGLGQALAFLRAKAGREGHQENDVHWLMYAHVSEWVLQQLQPNEQKERLLEWVIRQETAVYRRATTEAMAYLQWLKRFAEAILPEAAGSDA